MKVLFINNESSLVCGIAQFGRNMVFALREAGAEVEMWDGCYPVVKASGQYLPYDRLDTFDIVHFNWHPIVINHYGPGHFPDDIKLSLYVNDIPPWSGCPVFDQADIRFASQECEGCITIPYPCVAYTPQDTFIPGTVGTTGIRADGTSMVELVCTKHGFECVGRTPEWVPIEREVERLGNCAFNMLWYYAARGISGGAGTVVAAERPVLLNSSPMFDHFRGAKDIYWSSDYNEDPYEAAAVVMREVVDGKAKRPWHTKKKFGWPRAAEQFIGAWENLLR